MNRLFILIIIALLPLTGLAQSKKRVAAKSKKSAAAKVNAAINKLEAQYFDALNQQDSKTLNLLLAREFRGVQSDGLELNKADFIARIIAIQTAVEAPEDKQVRVLGSTAFVNGQAKWNNDRIVRYTEAWMKRANRWQLVSWQTTYQTSVFYLAKKLAGGKKVNTTPSGLQYVDLVEGNGESPKSGSQVQVHYTGTLENGQKFDSSVDRGQPFEFTIGIGRVIKGWDEGVLSMKVGGKRKLVIPAELGYGARGIGPIPPNSTLIFEVELLGVR